MKLRRKEERRLYALMESRGLLPGREGKSSPAQDPDLEKFISDCKARHPEAFQKAGRSRRWSVPDFRPTLVAACLLIFLIGGLLFVYKDKVRTEASRLARVVGLERTEQTEEGKPKTGEGEEDVDKRTKPREDLFKDPLRKIGKSRERTELAGRSVAQPEAVHEDKKDRDMGITAGRKMEGLWGELDAPGGEDEDAGKIAFFALRPMGGVDRRTCDKISEFIYQELKSRGDFKVTDQDGVVTLTPECVTMECWTRTVKTMGAGMAVSGSIGRSGRGCKITLELINADRAVVEKDVTVKCGCSEEELRKSAIQALVKLLQGWQGQ